MQIVIPKVVDVCSNYLAPISGAALALFSYDKMVCLGWVALSAILVLTVSYYSVFKKE